MGVADGRGRELDAWRAEGRGTIRKSLERGMARSHCIGIQFHVPLCVTIDS